MCKTARPTKVRSGVHSSHPVRLLRARGGVSKLSKFMFACTRVRRQKNRRHFSKELPPYAIKVLRNSFFKVSAAIKLLNQSSYHAPLWRAFDSSRARAIKMATHLPERCPATGPGRGWSRWSRRWSRGPPPARSPPTGPDSWPGRLL